MKKILILIALIGSGVAYGQYQQPIPIIITWRDTEPQQVKDFWSILFSNEKEKIIELPESSEEDRKILDRLNRHAEQEFGYTDQDRAEMEKIIKENM